LAIARESQTESLADLVVRSRRNLRPPEKRRHVMLTMSLCAK